MKTTKRPDEYLLCAAIHYNDGKAHHHQPKNIKEGFVICGRRHHNCIITADMLRCKTKRLPQVQGFLTNTDRFVDRTEAYHIAYDADQLLVKFKSTVETLISEDIY